MTAPAQSLARPADRLVSLDLLRLLAVVLVIGRHAEAIPDDWQSPFRPLVSTWINMGAVGVDIFFVLSGFLVSGLLFSEYKRRGELSLVRFYTRRAWKIYPAFYFFIGFTYVVQKYLVGWKMPKSAKFSELFFLQSYITGFWNHTWTLAVEEHFYLVMPLVLLVLVRRQPGAQNPFRAIPYLVAACSTIVLVARLINYLVRQEYSFLTHGFATHLRIDTLFFGVGLAYAYHFHGEAFHRAFSRWRYALMAAGVVALGSPFYYHGPYARIIYHTLGFTVLCQGAGALIIGALMCRIPSNRLVAGLAGLGSHSYSIYLWHMALMHWAMPHLRPSLSWPMRTAIYAVGAFVIGVVMAKLIELPLLKLRDRLYPSRSGEILTINTLLRLEPAARLAA
jgi:peptidoglycan/LPS O-acetylase OafA/YrhL